MEGRQRALHQEPLQRGITTQSIINLKLIKDLIDSFLRCNVRPNDQISRLRPINGIDAAISGGCHRGGKSSRRAHAGSASHRSQGYQPPPNWILTRVVENRKPPPQPPPNKQTNTHISSLFWGVCDGRQTSLLSLTETPADNGPSSDGGTAPCWTRRRRSHMHTHAHVAPWPRLWV